MLSFHYNSSFFLKPEKPAVSSANASANKRPTDSAMAISAGYPKRAKRPILDDVHVSSNGSLINNTNLASLSIDEREKLLQMLEQESSVRLLINFYSIEKELGFFFIDR